MLKWTEAIGRPEVKLVRILGNHEDDDMLDALFEYMLAVDSSQEDFAFVFNTPFSEEKNFSKDILQDLEEEINRWNTAKIPKTIPFETIEWEPDYSIEDEKNEAALLIKNLNSFANYLYPNKDVQISVILRMHYVTKEEAYNRLSKALEIPFEPHVKLGVSDTKNHLLFNGLQNHYIDEVYTIQPQFNMDTAMEEIAAMEDPSKPETPYRKHLIRLMEAVKKRQQNKVLSEGKSCLKIATKAIEKNQQWLMQIVTVYTILYTNEIGNKNYKEAIYFATKAVEAAQLSEQVLDPSMSYRLIGQTHIGRGSIYVAQKKWDKANEDYLLGAKSYELCADYMMHCESLRLCGWTFEKMGLNEQAINYYIEAYKLIEKLTLETIKSSTFPLVVKKIMNNKQREKQISDAKMDADLIPVFGEFWQQVVSDYGKVPNEVTIPVQ
ncbi:tetratricopeptide repeat protein (plasmid) [Tenacibaculum finnmarkense]|nr:tetratricopeptide repeat protein [Tenacibaculum finnmarkense]